MVSVLVSSTVLAAILQFVLWRHASRTHNAGWVDFGWSSGMAVAGIVLFLHSLGEPRGMAVSLLVVAWAGRLAWHILSDRLLKGKPEDERYQSLRKHWGEKADRNFLFFFVGQAFLVTLFITPASVVASRTTPFPDIRDALGLLTAMIAVGGEALSDRQLAEFRADPETKGKVCRRGFWKYTRHPNYFFEWVHWLAYVWMAVGADLWWLTWIGPVMMYVFLRYLTGVPHAERQSLRSRGEAYREYQQTTPVFFPWIPQKH
jgi:steroid 5-alpha reductase family enzyme